MDCLHTITAVLLCVLTVRPQYWLDFHCVIVCLHNPLASSNKKSGVELGYLFDGFSAKLVFEPGGLRSNCCVPTVAAFLLLRSNYGSVPTVAFQLWQRSYCCVPTVAAFLLLRSNCLFPSGTILEHVFTLFQGHFRQT